MNAASASAPTALASHWSRIAMTHLLDKDSCPACGADALEDGCCRDCGADLSGDLGAELWDASQRAVVALQARQDVLGRVPRAPRPLPVEARVAKIARDAASAPAVVATPRSSATVQSVLAVAGAGLFAVSAIVFTFFNPELTDRVLRSVVVGIVTVLFLGGAWLLARRRLQFSAEAVGALGMVFIALDLYAFSELTPRGLSPWAFAAVGTLVSGTAMVVIASVARIRTWLLTSILALATVPAMLGYAAGTALSATFGHLGSAFAALALVEVARAAARRFDGRLRAEHLTLTVVQVAAVVVTLGQVGSIDTGSTAAHWLIVSAVLALLAALSCWATRNLIPRFWSFMVGASGVGAIVVLPLALDLGSVGAEQWYLAVAPAAGALGLLAIGTLAPLPLTVDRPSLAAGALVLAAVSALVTVTVALVIGATTVLGSLTGSDLVRSVIDAEGVLAIVLGLLTAAFGAGIAAAVAARRDPTRAVWAARLTAAALWVTALAGLTVACSPGLVPSAQIAIALGLAVGTSAALALAPRLREQWFGLRLPLIVGAHLAIVLAVITSRTDAGLVVWGGVASVAAIAVVAAALGQAGVGTAALLCLTTAVGLIGAIVATSVRWVKPAAWYSILAVTSVPFVIGVVQVLFERSGWTALSTGIMFLLAITLLISRRPGLGVMLRSIAAGLLVPSLAVVVVCLGAQLLLGSASPVTLPVIAAIIALVLPAAGAIRSALVRHGISETDAAAARIAIEGSALLTGAIAVGLALIRVAAGLGTTFLVLVILAIGAAATSYWAKRRYGWWVAGACLTGALWCVWGIAGVSALEPYLLPPTLTAATIGLVLTARGAHGLPLYASGLVLAVAPILVSLAAGDSLEAPGRGYGLVAASWALLGLGALLGQGTSPRSAQLRGLRVPTFGVAIVAGAAGAIQGVHLGTSGATGPVPLVVVCLGIGLAGAAPAALSARAIRSAAPPTSRLALTRWLTAPAALYVALASWTAIERDWFTIWTMWSLMLAYLVTVVVVAVRLRRGNTMLPPVWFVFALAFITAIVAWSPRDLRVEWFSLPLGLFLLLAGVATMRGERSLPAGVGTVGSWPSRWHGSWPLLAPGLSVMFLASILATFTDPQTWRAILVMAIALVAILIGSSLKLAAPFLLGIIVLPIENVFVFAVQIGRGIESVPWWITLAVVGAVLLIIAVTYERRAGDDNSIGARLRDLM